MPVRTAARAASANLPSLLHAHLGNLPLSALGSFAPTKNKGGRPRKNPAPAPGTDAFDEFRLMMVGRTFLLGSLQLLARLMADAGMAAHIIQAPDAAAAPIQHRRKKRAAWGSKSRAGRKIKAKAKAK